MKTSQAGIEAIKRYEGCELHAYKDSVGIWTIGVGHTKGVKAGDVISQDTADFFLREDLRDAEEAVNALVVVPLTDGQYAALVSFVFNLGRGAFEKSTLLKMLNKGQYDAAADQFLRWNQAGGKVILGLVKRRTSERMMFLTGKP